MKRVLILVLLLAIVTLPGTLFAQEAEESAMGDEMQEGTVDDPVLTAALEVLDARGD